MDGRHAPEETMTNETMSWLWIGVVVLLALALVTGHQVF
jgi:hypothetical protein